MAMDGRLIQFWDHTNKMTRESPKKTIGAPPPLVGHSGMRHLCRVRNLWMGTVSRKGYVTVTHELCLVHE
jgi:hypothetical protein